MTEDYIEKANEAAEKLFREGRISEKDKERIASAAAAELGDESAERDRDYTCADATKDVRSVLDGFLKAAKNSAQRLEAVITDSASAFVKSYSFNLSDGTVLYSRKIQVRPWEKYESKTVKLKGTAEKAPFEAEFVISEIEQTGFPENLPSSAMPYVAVALEEKFSGVIKVCRPGLSLKIKIE